MSEVFSAIFLLSLITALFIGVPMLLFKKGANIKLALRQLSENYAFQSCSEEDINFFEAKLKGVSSSKIAYCGDVEGVNVFVSDSVTIVPGGVAVSGANATIVMDILVVAKLPKPLPFEVTITYGGGISNLKTKDKNFDRHLCIETLDKHAALALLESMQLRAMIKSFVGKGLKPKGYISDTLVWKNVWIKPWMKSRTRNNENLEKTVHEAVTMAKMLSETWSKVQ